MFLAREADVSIKPSGASAPGLRKRMISEPAKRAIAFALKARPRDSAATRSAGLVYFADAILGADARSAD